MVQRVAMKMIRNNRRGTYQWELARAMSLKWITLRWKWVRQPNLSMGVLLLISFL
jgi:hypothetical protein